MNRKVAIIIAAILLLGGIYVLGQAGGGSTASTLIDVGSADFLIPEGTSDPAGKLAALADEFERSGRTGDPLVVPNGVTVSSIGPSSKLISTGFIMGANKQYMVIVREDQAADLDIARVYVNDVLKFTATRANGAIVDNVNGSSIATMTFWQNPAQALTAKVESVTVGGQTYTTDISFDTH